MSMKRCCSFKQNWLQVFKEKEEVERGLDLLLYAYRDIVAYKAGLQFGASISGSERVFRRTCNEDDVQSSVCDNGDGATSEKATAQ